MSKKVFKEIIVDLTDAEFLAIAKMAHEQDITFNQMSCKILEEKFTKMEKEYASLCSNDKQNKLLTKSDRGERSKRKVSKT